MSARITRPSYQAFPSSDREPRIENLWRNYYHVSDIYYSQGRASHLSLLLGNIMAYALVFIALILIVTGVKGTSGAMLTTLKGDIAPTSGGVTHGYLAWLVAIFILGGIGYYGPMKRFMDAMLLLIVLAFVLAQKTGLWTNLTAAVNGTNTGCTAAQTTSAASTLAGGTGISGTGTTSNPLGLPLSTASNTSLVGAFGSNVDELYSPAGALDFNSAFEPTDSTLSGLNAGIINSGAPNSLTASIAQEPVTLF
jgi:hypothetical protein